MATPWKIPRVWENRTVAVLACGPSMSQEVADSVSGLPVIAVNNAFTLAPRANVLYACDSKFWLHYTDALAFKGLKVTLDDSLPQWSVRLLRNLGKSGFDPDDLSGVHAGCNSGYQAVQLAIKAGAKRVLLLGFDMRGDHFFGSHPAHLQDSDPHVFSRFIAEFEKVAPLYAEHGVDVVNCTPGSALHCFRMSTVAEELSHEPFWRDTAMIDNKATIEIPEASAPPVVIDHMERINRILRAQHGRD
jgi:hypothetical protein